MGEMASLVVSKVQTTATSASEAHSSTRFILFV